SVLAGVILVVALLPILRQPLATRGGSTLRSIRQPWWKRYYLDFGLLVFASWGLWQIMSARAEAGNSDPQAILTQSDPIFLLTPTLVLIALGSILLRFFPPITSVIARLLATNKALIPVLAGRQVSREPVHYARIALLLGLAVGVGGFVTSYHSTIEHSQFDQSRYQAGADVRLVEKNSASGAVGIRPLAAYTEHPLVTAVSPALRLVDVDLNQELFELGDGVVLAVDYDSLRDVAFWRDDLGELQNPYPASEPVLPAQGTALPFTPQKIGVWTRLTSSYFMEDGSAPEYGEWPLLTTQSELHLRLRDAAADPFEVTLAVQIIEGIADDALDQTLAAYATLYDETAEPDDAARAIITDSQTLSGWVYWEGDLSLPDAQGDLRLESVTLDYALPYTRNLRSFNHWQLELADFTLVDQQAQIMADWMTGDQWELVPINNSVIGDLVDDPTGQQEETTSPRGQRIIVQWNHTPDLRRGTWSFALLCNYPALPDIPVIASASFLEKNNLEIGMSFEQYLLHTDYTFRIIDSAAYYPTLYNDDAAFLVIDLASLLYVTNRNPAQAVYPSEVWVKLADGADPDVWLADLQQQSSAYFVAEQVTAVDLLATVEADPLSIGLLGLLYFSFGIVLVFSTIMLLTYTALTVHSRQSSFGVLQAFGVSSRRLVMGLAIEQLLVLGFASAVGSILGYVLTLYVLPPLANSATTQVITPPLIVYVSQSTILRHVVFMLGVLGLLLLANLLLIRQLSPAETIKMGEE
ncbi:MAG: ABC transporter permease, partial [Anaerolineae bacterium]|nr:ABC transporter permease [Anaerolineae bacterium]